MAAVLEVEVGGPVEREVEEVRGTGLGGAGYGRGGGDGLRSGEQQRCGVLCEGEPQRTWGLGDAGSGGAGWGCALRSLEGPWNGTAAALGHSELVGVWGK